VHHRAAGRVVAGRLVAVEQLVLAEKDIVVQQIGTVILRIVGRARRAVRDDVDGDVPVEVWVHSADPPGAARDAGRFRVVDSRHERGA
jgi:hypothetical protein